MLPILCKDCMQIPEYTLLEKNPLKNSSHKILVQQESCHPSKLSSLLHDFSPKFCTNLSDKRFVGQQNRCTKVFVTPPNFCHFCLMNFCQDSGQTFESRLLQRLVMNHHIKIFSTTLTKSILKAKSVTDL